MSALAMVRSLNAGANGNDAATHTSRTPQPTADDANANATATAAATSSDAFAVPAASPGSGSGGLGGGGVSFGGGHSRSRSLGKWKAAASSAGRNMVASSKARRESACGELLLRRFPCLGGVSRSALGALLRTVKQRVYSSRPSGQSDRHLHVLVREGEHWPGEPVMLLIASGSVDVYMQSPFLDGSRSRHPQLLLSRLGAGDEINAYAVCAQSVEATEMEHVRKKITYAPSPYTLVVSPNSEYKDAEARAAAAAVAAAAQDDAHTLAPRTSYVDPSVLSPSHSQKLVVYAVSLLAFRNLLCSAPLLYEQVQADVLAHLHFRQEQMERNAFAHTSIGGFSEDRTPFALVPSTAMGDALDRDVTAAAAAAAAVSAATASASALRARARSPSRPQNQGHPRFDPHAHKPYKFSTREVRTSAAVGHAPDSALVRILSAPPPPSKEQLDMLKPPSAFAFEALVGGARAAALLAPGEEKQQQQSRAQSASRSTSASVSAYHSPAPGASRSLLALRSPQLQLHSPALPPASPSLGGVAGGGTPGGEEAPPLDLMAVDAEELLAASASDEALARLAHAHVHGFSDPKSHGAAKGKDKLLAYLSPEEAQLRRYFAKQRAMREAVEAKRRAIEEEKYAEDLAAAVHRAMHPNLHGRTSSATHAPGRGHSAHHSRENSFGNGGAGTGAGAGAGAGGGGTGAGAGRGGSAAAAAISAAHALQATLLGGGGHHVRRPSPLHAPVGAADADLHHAHHLSVHVDPAPSPAPNAAAAAVAGAVAAADAAATPGALSPSRRSSRRPSQGDMTAHAHGAALSSPVHGAPRPSSPAITVDSAAAPAVAPGALRRSPSDFATPAAREGSSPPTDGGASVWPNYPPPFPGPTRLQGQDGRNGLLPPVALDLPAVGATATAAIVVAPGAATEPAGQPAPATPVAPQQTPVPIGTGEDDAEEMDDHAIGRASLLAFEAEAASLLARAQARAAHKARQARKQASKNANARISALRAAAGRGDLAKPADAADGGAGGLGGTDASESSPSRPSNSGSLMDANGLMSRRFCHSINTQMYAPTMRLAMGAASAAGVGSPAGLSASKIAEVAAAKALQHNRNKKKQSILVRGGAGGGGPGGEHVAADPAAALAAAASASASPAHARKHSSFLNHDLTKPGARVASAGVSASASAFASAAGASADAGDDADPDEVEITDQVLEDLFHLGTFVPGGDPRRGGKKKGRFAPTPFVPSPAASSQAGGAVAGAGAGAKPGAAASVTTLGAPRVPGGALALAAAASPSATAPSSPSAPRKKTPTPLFTTPTRNSNGALLEPNPRGQSYSEFFGGCLNVPEAAVARAQALASGVRLDMVLSDAARRVRAGVDGQIVSAVLGALPAGGGDDAAEAPAGASALGRRGSVVPGVARHSGRVSLGVGSPVAARRSSIASLATTPLERSPVNLLGFVSTPAEHESQVSPGPAAAGADPSAATSDESGSSPAKRKARLSFSFGFAMPASLATLTEEAISSATNVNEIASASRGASRNGSRSPSRSPSRRGSVGVSGGGSSNGSKSLSPLLAAGSHRGGAVVSPLGLARSLRASLLHGSVISEEAEEGRDTTRQDEAVGGEAASSPSSRRAPPLSARRRSAAGVGVGSGNGDASTAGKTSSDRHPPTPLPAPSSSPSTTLPPDHRVAGTFAPTGSRLTLNTLHTWTASDWRRLRARVRHVALEARQRGAITLSDIFHFQGLENDPAAIQSSLGLSSTIGTRASHVFDLRSIVSGASLNPSRGIHALAIILYAFGEEHPVHGVKPGKFKLTREMSGEAVQSKKERLRAVQRRRAAIAAAAQSRARLAQQLQDAEEKYAADEFDADQSLQEQGLHQQDEREYGGFEEDQFGFEAVEEEEEEGEEEWSLEEGEDEEFQEDEALRHDYGADSLSHTPKRGAPPEGSEGAEQDGIGSTPAPSHLRVAHSRNNSSQIGTMGEPSPSSVGGARTAVSFSPAATHPRHRKNAHSTSALPRLSPTNAAEAAAGGSGGGSASARTTEHRRNHSRSRSRGPSQSDLTRALTFLTLADPALLEEALTQFNFFGIPDEDEEAEEEASAGAQNHSDPPVPAGGTDATAPASSDADVAQPDQTGEDEFLADGEAPPPPLEEWEEEELMQARFAEIAAEAEAEAKAEAAAALNDRGGAESAESTVAEAAVSAAEPLQRKESQQSRQDEAKESSSEAGPATAAPRKSDARPSNWSLCDPVDEAAASEVPVQVRATLRVKGAYRDVLTSPTRAQIQRAHTADAFGADRRARLLPLPAVDPGSAQGSSRLASADIVRSNTGAHAEADQRQSSAIAAPAAGSQGRGPDHGRQGSAPASARALAPVLGSSASVAHLSSRLAALSTNNTPKASLQQPTAQRSLLSSASSPHLGLRLGGHAHSRSASALTDASMASAGSSRSVTAAAPIPVAIGAAPRSQASAAPIPALTPSHLWAASRARAPSASRGAGAGVSFDRTQGRPVLHWPAFNNQL